MSQHLIPPPWFGLTPIFLPFPVTYVLIGTDSTLDPIFDVLQALFLPAPFLTPMVGELQIRSPIPLPTLQSKLV